MALKAIRWWRWFTTLRYDEVRGELSLEFHLKTPGEAKAFRNRMEHGALRGSKVVVSGRQILTVMAGVGYPLVVTDAACRIVERYRPGVQKTDDELEIRRGLARELKDILTKELANASWNQV